MVLFSSKITSLLTWTNVIHSREGILGEIPATNRKWGSGEVPKLQGLGGTHPFPGPCKCQSVQDRNCIIFLSQTLECGERAVSLKNSAWGHQEWTEQRWRESQARPCRVFCGGVNTRAQPASWVHPKWACEEETRWGGWRQRGAHQIDCWGCFLLLLRSFWAGNVIYSCRILNASCTLNPGKFFPTLSPSSAPLCPHWFPLSRMFPPQQGLTFAVLLAGSQAPLCTQLPPDHPTSFLASPPRGAILAPPN